MTCQCPVKPVDTSRLGRKVEAEHLEIERQLQLEREAIEAQKEQLPQIPTRFGDVCMIKIQWAEIAMCVRHFSVEANL